MSSALRPYVVPTLVRFGRVSDLTAGGSGTRNESVMIMNMMGMVMIRRMCGMMRQVPPGDPCNNIP